MSTEKKFGYVAIVGRPNVGKSTLLNALIGEKVSITTAKPQTTRHQILGIHTKDALQIAYIDTPGLHADQNKKAMNRYMNRLATSVMTDANVLVFVIEAGRWSKEDEAILTQLARVDCPVVLAINKLDKLPDKKMCLPLIADMQHKFAFAHIIPISAKKQENLDELVEVLAGYIPVGAHLFPDDEITDRNEKFRIAEIIREKVILATAQELPYATTVAVELIKLEGKLLRIHAVIWVERDSQKAIVIGTGGEKLKRVGTLARKDIEAMMGVKVFLKLWVKVKSDWTDDERALGSLGYE